MATKSKTGVNSGPTPQGVNNNNSNNANRAGGGGGGGGATENRRNVNTVIIRTVTAFLASGKRNSSNSKTSDSSRRRTRKTKMDESSAKINPKLLEQLKKKTRFTKDEIEALFRIYRKLVANNQYAAKSLASGPAGAIAKPQTQEGIDRIVFRELLHSTFDIVTEEILMERIFCSWDKAHEGLPIRLEGWLIGLSTFLRGNPVERAGFCFRVYDLNGDGYITKDEMFTLLRNCLIKQPQDEDPDEGVKDLVEIVLKKFDVDKDGKVSLEDFMATVSAQPLLIEAFGQCLPTDSAIVSFFSTLQV
ncbi:calaxin [Haematobia irritans]|uniref:calaxin n=1 Tax=Haematobia irritans TaxID=7368 RepID=UPI003F4FEE7A